MKPEEIQNFADENKLDVKPLDKSHWRLEDQWGKKIIDIYFKWNKRHTEVKKNTVMHWKSNKWTVAYDLNQLAKLIK